MNEKQRQQIHRIFLELGEALMEAGTHKNMKKKWYKTMDKLIEKGIDIVFNAQFNAFNKINRLDGGRCPPVINTLY